MKPNKKLDKEKPIKHNYYPTYPTSDGTNPIDNVVKSIKQNLNNEKLMEELEQILEDNFPKLNKDNPEIASSNNRSAALVMFAHTKMLIQKLLLSERQKIIKEFSESKILLSEKEFEEILKNKKEHSELREKLVIQEVRKDVLREVIEKYDSLYARCFATDGKYTKQEVDKIALSFYKKNYEEFGRFLIEKLKEKI